MKEGRGREEIEIRKEGGKGRKEGRKAPMVTWQESFNLISCGLQPCTFGETFEEGSLEG